MLKAFDGRIEKIDRDEQRLRRKTAKDKDGATEEQKDQEKKNISNRILRIGTVARQTGKGISPRGTKAKNIRRNNQSSSG